MDVEIAREMVRPERMDRIGRYPGRRWDFWQRSPVRPKELELTGGPSLHAEALLVDRAMVPATEQGEIRERGRAAVRPVTDVMALAPR